MDTTNNTTTKPAALKGITQTKTGFVVRVSKRDHLTGKNVERTQTVAGWDIQEAFKVKEELSKALSLELEQGKENSRDISQGTYENFITFYQNFRKNNGLARENVISMDREVFSKFVVPHISQVKVGTLNKRIVFHFIDRLRDMVNENGVPYALHTYKRAFQLFKQSVRFAYKMGFLDHDPTHLVSARFPLAKAPREKGALTREQAAKLLEAAGKEGTMVYALVAVAVVCGLRTCELKSLTYGDINFEEGTISVSKSFHNGVLNRSVKNGRAFKTAMVGVVFEAVKAHFQATCAGKKPENIFFASLRAKSYFETSWFNSVLKRLCLTAGIPVISAHGARRTACSVLLMNGNVPQSVAMKLLNHKTLSVSEDHYTIVNAREMATVLERVWKKPD